MANVVVTELVRSIQRSASSWRVRVMAVGFAVLLLMALIVYRFSPKTSYADCVFRISSSDVTPETQGDSNVLDNCVQLEKAASNSARTLGLSGRASMDRNKGMLFDFATSGEYCMWMKDMHFDLDMIWLNDQYEIVHMIEGVTPDTYPKSFCGPASARYVVELNSGIIKAADLHVGQRIRL
ncbi:DUF192 domain-containing protein [Candidatus Saccharibacteria bacterium]|nr:DUF192 domain-containing protein [Candidatus Saccharibacteria bacterium]